MNIIRKKSWLRIEALGLKANIDLPLLDTDYQVKSFDEIVNRVLCLNSILLSINKILEKEKIIDWLETNNLFGFLSNKEKEYFLKGQYQNELQTNVESLYILMWVLSLYKETYIKARIPDDLISKVSVNIGKTIIEFKASCSIRKIDDIIKEADFLYCFDWANTNYSIENKDYYFHSYVVKQRRKGIEWVFSPESWDDVIIDT